MRTRVFTATQDVTIGANIVDARDTTVTNLYLRRFTEAAGVYTYAEEIAGIPMGNGQFKFTFPDGNYQLWKSAYPNVNALNFIDDFSGSITDYVALVDEQLPYIKNVVDVSGDYWEGQSKEIRSIGATTEPNSAIRRSEADLRFAAIGEITTINTELANKVSKTGATQATSALITFEQLPQMVEAAGLDAGTFPIPTNAGDIIYNQYFQSQLPRFNQSNRLIRVVPDLSVGSVTGKAYKTIVEAVTYANTQLPSISRQFTILIESMGTDASLITAVSGSLQPYIHLVGVGKHIRVAIGNNSTAGLNTNIENLTVFFSANDIGTDRTFTGLSLLECHVYAYRDITFSGSVSNIGRLHNNKLASFGATVYKFTGTTEVYHNVFKNDYTELTETPVIAGNSVTNGMLIESDPVLPS